MKTTKTIMGERSSPIMLILPAVSALLILFFAAFFFVYEHEKEEDNIYWAYAAEDILCIGDSLTKGNYFGMEMGGADIVQNYPYYLQRMLNTDVTNAGYGGYSPSDWYTKNVDSYDFSQYDLVIIWLGTNYAPTNTLEQDVTPFASPDQYAETETGYYCRLIEKIYNENPSCIIFLMNLYATKSDLEEANAAIANIASYYGLPLIDVSDMGSENYPEYHAGSTNPHLGKAGNIYAASLIVNELNNYFESNPLRCEFSIEQIDAAAGE